VCRSIALGVQVITGAGARRKLAQAERNGETVDSLGVPVGQRIAAGLLAVTVICMAISRFA
ncbi:MAG: hypothetical protein ACRD3Q_05455, partial [Terriglobales bacterium]